MTGERGAIPVELAASVGLLLFPIFVFVMTIAPVVERRTVADRTAAEAVRAFVVADDAATGLADAQSVVDQANANHPYTLSLSLEGDLERGALVTATVGVEMPVIIFPGVVEVRVGTYTASHREAVDQFRSLP